MNKIATFITIGATALVLAGCSASGVNPVNPSRVCNLGANVLQMNVGTANLFGLGSGTNVAVTYRQSGSANCYAGNSGSLVNTPTLTLPTALAGPAGTADGFGSTILTGPAAGEIGTTSMTSIPQLPADTNNTALTSTFGDDGGAFGLGLEPFNYAGALGTAGVVGKPASVFPYPVPVYDTTTPPDINQFTPGGGPPAFNPLNNTAATLGGFNGISEGFDVFQIAPVAGTFSLSVLVPANTGNLTATATAPITSTALLPTVAAPTYPAGFTYTAASGVVTFSASGPFPGGVTQEYIQVTDIGPTTAGATSCVGATPANPVYYTTVLTSPGTPAPIPAPGLCSAAANTTASGMTSDGDEFGVQLIGLDYNWYGASYTGITGVGGLGVPAPSLTGTGAAHQADITISPLTEYTLPATNIPTAVPPGSLTPLAVRRHH